MSTINVPVLYQTETFSSGFRQRSSRDERSAAARPPGASPGQRTMRAPEFLVQMIAHGDPDLRKVLGRREVASARERAYAFAHAHKPSNRAGEELRTEFRA